MKKNCGNCKWWDSDNSVYSNAAEEMKAKCQYKMPFWVCADTFKSFQSDGQNCPTWEERK